MLMFKMKTAQLSKKSTKYAEDHHQTSWLIALKRISGNQCFEVRSRACS